VKGGRHSSGSRRGGGGGQGFDPDARTEGRGQGERRGKEERGLNPDQCPERAETTAPFLQPMQALRTQRSHLPPAGPRPHPRPFELPETIQVRPPTHSEKRPRGFSRDRQRARKERRTRARGTPKKPEDSFGEGQGEWRLPGGRDGLRIGTAPGGRPEAGHRTETREGDGEEGAGDDGRERRGKRERKGEGDRKRHDQDTPGQL